MRLRLVLALLGLAALAWLLSRTARPDGPTLAKPVPSQSSSQPQLPEAEPGRMEKPAPANRARADAPGFEPLPEDPSEIVVHLRDHTTGARVLGAEVFVREQQTWNGSPAGYDAHRPWLDVE